MHNLLSIEKPRSKNSLYNLTLFEFGNHFFLQLKSTAFVKECNIQDKHHRYSIDLRI